jgi:adenine/guanine phosphoribosyltransferase-like PRPP-binding protein
MSTTAFTTGYCDIAFTDINEVIRTAKRKLRQAKVLDEFDTLVGTGFSGGLVVPMLANELDKDFVLIRKPRDNSHHSGRMVGVLGERWLFVDDFISSGTTLRRVQRIVTAEANNRYHETEQLGSYYYRGMFSGEPNYIPAKDLL